MLEPTCLNTIALCSIVSIFGMKSLKVSHSLASSRSLLVGVSPLHVYSKGVPTQMNKRNLGKFVSIFPIALTNRTRQIGLH